MSLDSARGGSGPPHVVGHSLNVWSLSMVLCERTEIQWHRKKILFGGPEMLPQTQQKRATSACHRGFPRKNLKAVVMRSIAVFISMLCSAMISVLICCGRLAV